MAKVSIWKRVGGWLRRSDETIQSDSPPLDAEGLLIEPEHLSPHRDGSEQAESATLVSRSKNHQIGDVEDGFNRLVGVLESINANVAQQREAGLAVRGQLEVLPELLNSFAQSVEIQQKLLKSLTETGSNQLEHLEGIRRDTENTSHASQTMAETMERVDHTSREIAIQGKSQTAILQTLGEYLQKSQTCTEELLRKQARLHRWVSFITITMLLVAVISSLIAWWSLSRASVAS